MRFLEQGKRTTVVQLEEGHQAEGNRMGLSVDGIRPRVKDGMAEVRQHTTCS